MAEIILTDRSFFLNNLFYSGSFLFDTREDAFALTSTHLESIVAPLFSIMANNYARVLMAGCLSSKLVKENVWRPAGYGTTTEGIQQSGPAMRQCCIKMGPLPIRCSLVSWGRT